MSTFAIKIDGVDVTASTIIKDCEFNSAAKGAAGAASFRLRDEAHMYAFNTGNTLTLDVDGVRVWTGYVAKIERGYFFEADCRCKTAITPRYLRIIGTDVNVLLHKRILYDHSTPERMKLDAYPPDTFDSVILTDYLTNFTDIGDDGVTLGLIEHVGTPSKDTDISGSASWSVDELCRMLVYNTGAIYYIDPDKVFVLTDVDTPNAAFGISDTPGAGEIGCREFEIDYDGSGLRNDALAWGVGQGSTVPVFSRITSEASIAEHGLWQVGDFANSVFRQATINKVARTYVFGSPQSKRGGKDDRVSIKCTVFEPNFRVAQKVNVRSEVFGYEDVIPIRAQKITFPTHQDVRFDLLLSHDIDDPWSTFEFWFPKIILPPFPDIILPELPVFPPNDPCRGVDGDTRCIETFSRTLATGWGDSEIAGTWVEDDNTYFYTDGTYGIIERDPDPPFGQTAFITDGVGVQVPFEMVITSKWTRNASVPSLDGFWGQTYLTLDTPNGAVGSQPFQQPVVELGWWYEDGTLTGQPNKVRMDIRALRQPPVVYSATTAPSIADATTPITVRWRVEDTAMYVKQWAAGSAEPLAWGEIVTGMSGLAGAYLRMNVNMGLGSVSTRGFVEGVQHLWDTWEIVEGLVCNGAGEGGFPCDLPVDTALTQWTESTDTGYTPAAVSGFDFHHVLQSSGVNDVYFGGRLDFAGAALASPLCVSGTFTITKKGSGSGSGNPGSLFDIRMTGGTFLRIGWDASPFVNGYYQFSTTGQYKIWRTIDGEPSTWSTITGAQSMNWQEDQSYSYRIQYTGATAPALSYALEQTQGPAGVSFDSAVSISQPVVSNNSSSTDPCEEPPDLSTRRLCETLTRIDPPENASAEYAYYQASYSMAFGSDEVWIDGIRIDFRDYTLYGLRDVVAIYDRFSVGGLDASDPPKTVHACYIAVGLVVT